MERDEERTATEARRGARGARFGSARLRMVMAVGLGVAAPACVAGCGDEEPVDAVRPDKALVAAVPDPFDRAAQQAPNTFVGKVGLAGWTYIAVVTRGNRALVYLCDGRASEWFGAPVHNGRVFVRSSNGTVVDAHVSGGSVRGTVRPDGQSRATFTATPPGGPGRGLFNGPDPAVPGHLRRWIVLADGVRGVSDPPATATGDVSAGSGTATRPTSAPTPRTTSVQTVTAPPSPPPATSTASNPTFTAPASTAPPKTTPTTSTATATNPTFSAPATTAPPKTTATTTTPTTTTGTKTISDGTSNTIVVGETPPGTTTTTPIATTSTAPTATTPATTAPAGCAPSGASQSTTTTLTTVGDGTSNTIVVGASAGTTCGTTTREAAPRTSTTADGSSNTLVLGVDPINGLAAGPSVPPIPTAATVTQCPVLQPCPALPPRTLASPSLGTTSGGNPDTFPGGGLVDCRTLATLIASVSSAAKRGDPTAIKQLSALTTQARANGC